MNLTVKDQVLLFVADEVEKTPSKTIESIGLGERAALRNVCTTSDAFRGHLALLKREGFIESTRAGGTTYLYCLTSTGEQRVQRLKQDIANQKVTESQEDSSIPSKTLAEQLREKMEITDSGHYSAPGGIPLPKNGQYTQDVDGIFRLYKDRINTHPTENEKQRLQEEFDKLTLEGRPAFSWLQEAICRTSTKVRSEQRTIAYMLGILKNWRSLGYGTDYSAENKKMFAVFERRFDCLMTDASRQKFLELIDKHGVVDAMDAMYNLREEEIDPAMRFLLQIETYLNKQEG